MEDDLIASLTHQVKEEVVENYLAERLLLEVQAEELAKLAEEARAHAARSGRRLTRMAHLVIQPDMLGRLAQLLRIPADSFWSNCLKQRFSHSVRFIRVRGLTDKAKFRKLMLESYSRLYLRMGEYRKTYESFQAECLAVNNNITRFQKNFDLLTIINFLKSLDTVTLERKIYLGENFTAQEMASIDQKLHIKPIACDRLDVPQPLPLAKPESLEGPLTELAISVYKRFQGEVKRILQ